MTGCVVNLYPTDEAERLAHTTTYANQARAAIWAHLLANDNDALRDCPWMAKVESVLWDAVQKLEALAEDETAHRPGMLEAGLADARALWAQRHGELADSKAGR